MMSGKENLVERLIYNKAYIDLQCAYVTVIS